MPAEEAIGELKKLPGIGDFSAELVLLRGAGEPDYLPTNEPRLGRAVAMAYGQQTSRRPSRSWKRWPSSGILVAPWVSLYLRTILEDETGEISGGSKATT